MPTITMDDSRVVSIEQLRAFLKLDRKYRFGIADKKGRYQWIAHTLTQFSYHRLKKKKDRSVVRRYIRAVTGMSNGQLTRVIAKHKKRGELIPDYASTHRNGFKRKYGPNDIALLITTDAAHEHLSGEATKKILEREYHIFGHDEYKTISRISVSHVYNIRNHNRQYGSSSAKWVARTKATPVNIGIRAKPRPNGQPGFLRVDTVHSGDLGKQKGAYHINIVDEVTQWEMVATVPAISEEFLKPVIEELLVCFPFRIHEFHSDNGSEFINHVVAKLLTNLYIRFTKSRARHSNDNALVESKNGSVIRKLYGHSHMPAAWAPAINEFNRLFVNVYLNYHRPCGFAALKTDKRGKEKKTYTHWMTPYEKFASLDKPEQYLKPGVMFEQLAAIAGVKSDNEFAREMQQAKVALFMKLRKTA
jgi:hypothetical protein